MEAEVLNAALWVKVPAERAAGCPKEPIWPGAGGRSVQRRTDDRVPRRARTRVYTRAGNSALRFTVDRGEYPHLFEGNAPPPAWTGWHATWILCAA